MTLLSLEGILHTRDHWTPYEPFPAYARSAADDGGSYPESDIRRAKFMESRGRWDVVRSEIQV